MSMSWGLAAASIIMGSSAYLVQWDADWGTIQHRGARGRASQFQYTERFPPEVQEKAWELLKKYMTPEQHFAFMEGTNIELENKAGSFRLLINKRGDFTILQGSVGAGIVASTGRIHSYDYPLGDEIAAFLDWFKHRTEELIAQWNCGTYGIKEDGLRR